MILQILNSSSAGNCYLLKTANETLILECGVRFSIIQKALKYDFSKVLGVLLSHEHGDHSRSAGDILKAAVPVYCSRGAAEALKIRNHHRVHTVGAGQFEVGNFLILPFPTQHDAQEPLGFLIYHKPTKEKLLFATDTHYIRSRFRGVNYFLVECNYIPEVLQENIELGRVDAARAAVLKNHMSLPNCKKFLQINKSFDTRNIVLLHLSGDNSDGDRMIKEISELTGIDTVIAEPGKVIEL